MGTLARRANSQQSCGLTGGTNLTHAAIMIQHKPGVPILNQPAPARTSTQLPNVSQDTPARSAGTPARHRGFTLIELMVVLVIIGVLAALIVPNVLDRADDARTTAAKTDVNNLMQSLKLYRLDNQRYPTSEQGLAALIAKPTAAPVPPNWRPYLDKLPADPWGRPYAYLNPGVHGEIDVLSLGADGQPGGEGKNADIGSWQP